MFSPVRGNRWARFFLSHIGTSLRLSSLVVLVLFLFFPVDLGLEAATSTPPRQKPALICPVSRGSLSSRQHRREAPAWKGGGGKATSIYGTECPRDPPARNHDDACRHRKADDTQKISVSQGAPPAPRANADMTAAVQMPEISCRLRTRAMSTGKMRQTIIGQVFPDGL